VIIAGYMALILSSIGLGMTVAESPTFELPRLLSTIATILIAVFIPHNAYTKNST
jgi:hypothetical protein